MRELIKEFVSICAQTLPLEEPIYEFGSLQVPGQEGFADLRPLFPGKEYVGSDMQEGPGVDIVLNLHDLALPAHTVGTALVADTLEHVEFPFRAIEQVHKVMHPDGIVLISSHMQAKIHAYPNDYWRFTPEGFRVLLKPFTDSLVSYAGAKKFPHTVVGIGFKGAKPPVERLTAALADWQARWETLPQPPLWVKWNTKFRKSFKKRWDVLVKRL
jgi:SAM-dependent methyltransferase